MTIKEFKIQYALGSMSHRVILDMASSFLTYKEILTILSKDKDWSIRCNVVYNWSTLPTILGELAFDKNISVKCWSARNPNTPIEVLTTLSIDKDRVVRNYAIHNLEYIEWKNNASKYYYTN